MRGILLYCAIWVVLLVVVGGGAYFFDRTQCYAKTADMGYPARYALFGGCRIEVTPGQWIPLDSYYFKQPGG